ncbi:lipopolysaccharide biosynthesis protein [Dysgonomonas macrotermitis]|uniref:Membrane protein involved in the export of O-antigen and teichoic acid n=1 Tax=Dysgonomonas macrotermitis TaxID=1346286 RepID=A0A1M5I445_9BACT|nr:hypothetical protein [Dysgonomonas macrotermitis]SHG23001.1 hypothetical protein SAMN05444362_11833 [Dysgonomonas macrotermitis]
MSSYILRILKKIGIGESSYKADFINFSIGYIIASALSLLSIVVVNKYLQPEELGRFSYIKSILELLYGVLSVNIYSSYLRFNIKGDNPHVKRLVHRVVLFSTVVLVFFIFFFTKSFICIPFAFIIIYNERMYYFRSLMKMKELNIARILPVFLTFLIITGLFLFFKDLVTGYMIIGAYGIGYTVCLLLLKGSGQETIEKQEFDIIPTKTILKFCIPAMLLVLVDWILNFSAQIFIKEHFGYFDVARYAVSQRALLTIKLFTGLLLMFYPMMYYREIAKGNQTLIRKSRYIMIFLVLSLALLLFVFSKYVYILMGAKAYVNDLGLFRVLLIAECVRVVSSFFLMYLTYVLKTVLNLLIYLTSAMLNIVLLFFFLKDGGIIFAAYSSLISTILIFVLSIVIAHKQENAFFRKQQLS